MQSDTISQSSKQRLVGILKGVVSQCELDALAVVTREGQKIAFFSPMSMDTDLLSALSAAVLATGNMVTNRLEQGNLREVIVSGNEGFTLLTKTGSNILIGASNDLHSLALTMQVMRKAAEDVIEILG